MLLLQEDVLLFLLRCKHLFTPSNFTSAACLFATSEGRLYRSYSGFFRTDIPSSQYRSGSTFQRSTGGAAQSGTMDSTKALHDEASRTRLESALIYAHLWKAREKSRL